MIVVNSARVTGGGHICGVDHNPTDPSLPATLPPPSDQVSTGRRPADEGTPEDPSAVRGPLQRRGGPGGRHGRALPFPSPPSRERIPLLP